jgi:hypothetical protein
MVESARRDAEAHWQAGQGEYVGLSLGLLLSKDVPGSLHNEALEEVLLACWARIELGVMPEADLPGFYQSDDPLRAALQNWLLVLVEVWASLFAHRPAPARVGEAASTARELLRFVRALPAGARARLRRSAALVGSN